MEARNQYYFMGFAILAILAGSAAAEERPPNILFLIADDMPWKTVAALSGEDIELK